MNKKFVGALLLGSLIMAEHSPDVLITMMISTQ